MFEQLARDHRVEARVAERERLFDIRLNGLDPELSRPREGGGVDVQADDVVSLEEVARQRARAASEVEHPLAGPDRSLEQRDPLGDEDEVAFVATLAVMGLVPLAEITHAEPPAASWPSEIGRASW